MTTPLTDRVRSPWARKALAIAGLLVAANLVLAVVGPALPEPVTYPTREIQLMVDLLDEQTADSCVDLLVTGNSIAAHDVSATDLASELGLESGVVSVLPGSIASVDVDWMNRVTLPRADPGTVVYVVSPLTFAPATVAERYGLGIYTRAVATRGGWPGDLHRWATDNLALFEYRLALADFAALSDGVEGELPTSYAEILAATGRTVDADGHIRAIGSFGGSAAFLETLGAAAQLVSDIWEVDQSQVDALGDQFTALEADGRRVVMVIPPVSSALPAVFPGGQQGYDEYLEAARRVGLESGVPTVDLSNGAYPDSAFWDTHHLNEQGARQLTSELARHLAALDAVSCRRTPPVS